MDSLPTEVDIFFAIVESVRDEDEVEVNYEKSIQTISEDNRLRDRQTWKHSKYKHGLNKFK